MGRQNFLLLRAGERELFQDNLRLTTEECLDFLLNCPRKAILVGYFFTYDATQILRDMPDERIRKLFEDKPKGAGKSPYTFWGKYAIDFRPRQYFRVAKVKFGQGRKMQIESGSARTVNEVGAFFQSSFVESLRKWNVGDTATVERIAATKERRAEFSAMSQIERDYCADECRLLAELMEAFRACCEATSMVPAYWRGPGAIAAALHKQHGTPRRADLVREPELQEMAIRAYYGGRFEVTQIGRIPGPLWECDLRSAYPAAMQDLPCPVHTIWRKLSRREALALILDDDAADPFVATVTFMHAAGQPLCGFPFRHDGRLFWPEQGQGTYWHWEIAAAIRAGAFVVNVDNPWKAEKHCDCTPFAWVRDLYDYRISVGKSNRGQAIKLGLNSLYGKLAQRSGGAPYRDHIAAGLITAWTRARLIDAYAQAPQDCVMLATDAVFSRSRLALDCSPALGHWEEVVHPDGLFVVQPGIYWSPGSDLKPKTRGIPRSRIINRRNDFEDQWQRWLLADRELAPPPAIPIDMTSFIGHRLALHRNKVELAGRWMELIKHISFDWGKKRGFTASLDGEAMITRPLAGDIGRESETFDPAQLISIYENGLVHEAYDDYQQWGHSDE